MSQPENPSHAPALDPDPSWTGTAYEPVPGPRAGLSGKDLSGQDLSGKDLENADLTGAVLLKANLQGANLTGARLEGAEMTGACLREANFQNADARRAGLGHADLRGARLFNSCLEGATLTHADLSGADLRCVNLRGGRLREASLDEADLTSADLQGADMSQSSVSGAVLDNADLRGAQLRAVRGFEKASWIGTDLRDVNFAGAYRLRRFVVDQNYLKEFRDSSRWAEAVYRLWWLTSDCGRSAARWCACIAALVAIFAWLYRAVAVDWGPHGEDWLTSIYYSVVTLTTLGYGEVVPASDAGKVVVTAEVITGYMMLGGLLSIFANKLSRRGD